ncbi:T-cell immunomodulatory protein [Mycena venus]|uniref:T-cell immunomodulatory protein n=1 Tax=Mycena venus TaxID=2733690 RepID=A0A8H7CYT0_9AGAR|nr:T-cell immunomodulatory protein [Mycena venus]
MYRHLLGRRKRLYGALIALSWLSDEAAAMWPFPPKRFSANSLVDAGSMGINVQGRVIAFGDFNGDQYLDALTLDSDQQTLTVYLWSHDDFVFHSSATFTHPLKIQNVVPGDFTHSGKLDLLVMAQGSQSNQLDLSVYTALPGGGFDTSNPLSVPASALPQPIPIDVDGDMKIDLLGMSPSSQGLQVWQNVWNASDPLSPLFNVVDPLFKGAQCTLANPHSNAVVDLNGDCLADVFLLCDNGSYQIWVNNKADGFSLALQGSMPSGVRSVSFADVDRDGTIDMVFITCSSISTSTGVGSDCVINIAYNKQLPLCTTSVDSGVKKGVRTCRPPEDLCTADPTFTFDLTDSADNEAYVRMPINSLFPGSSLVVLDTTPVPALPISLKLGDANLDGFPDMLVIIASGQDHVPKMLFSVPCGAGVSGCRSGHGKRGWSVATKGTETLDAVKDARSVSFLDMDEDGTLDIMVQRTGTLGQGNVLFVQNNFYYDAFFLKAIVLNGACGNGWCYGPNGTERYHPFGVSYSGASYKYTVLDTTGGRSAAQVGQLPQTSYQSLQTPYSFFGLGRTNNYIENLFVGSTMHTAEHYINMEGVIPNSKVVILPPSKAGDPWKRELFLRPGEWIPWVTLTVVVGTVLLAVIVLVLHLNEKREDELERRRASHHINFDAL